MKRLLIILPCFLLVTTCKKYDHDERRYLKTACGRIARTWELYRITDGIRDYQDSVIYFTQPENDWIKTQEQSFTYGGLLMEFDRSDNLLCLETGITGAVKILNRPFSSGTYELRNKRSRFSFDVRPHEKTPVRYFQDTYRIYKLTKDELIFGNEPKVVYFRAAR